MNRIVVIASHRRSGTHLILDLLRRNGLGVDPSFVTLERLDPAHPKHLTVAELDRRLQSKRGVALVKTHALPNATAWPTRETGEYASELLARWPTIYVHRDGRDVLVSLYHFIASYSAQVAEQSFGEFIRAAHTGPDASGLSRAAYWQHHVLEWLRKAPTTRASYEELRRDFAAALPAIADRVGLPLRADLSPVLLDERRHSNLIVRGAQRLLRLRHPVSSSAIRPRAGMIGGWRAVFSETDARWFDNEAGAAMAVLGRDEPVGEPSSQR